MPEFDDRALFEKLILDGFQAGLSWITILRKRENFRKAFDDFAPEKIARYTPKKVERLMQDAGIVRNRAKIEGTVGSARAWLKIMDEGPGFSHLLWDRLDGKPQQNNFRRRGQIPAETALSKTISKELIGRGFKFVGPTIVYAFMQAVGMVNDHLHAATATQRWPSSQQTQMSKATRQALHRAPGSACCRGAGSICSTPRRSTWRSKTSRMGWRASRAGTGRPRARISIRSPSTRCWSRRWRERRCRGSSQSPARRAAARRARIRDRRHDLAVQGGDRRQLQGGRISPARRHPSPLRPALAAAGQPAEPDQGRRPQRRLSRIDAACRLRRWRKRGAFSGSRRSFPLRWNAIISPPGRPAVAEARFKERFEKLARELTMRTNRHRYDATTGSLSPPMIHVCSLARLYATVDEIRARHIVTLLRLTDRVKRPSTSRRKII